MLRVTATAPASTAAATAAKEPTVGAKRLGETKADYPSLSVRTVSRIYGLGMEDKFTITKVSEGNLTTTSSALLSMACCPKGGVSMHPLKGRLHTLVKSFHGLPPIYLQASTAHHGPRLLQVSCLSAGIRQASDPVNLPCQDQAQQLWLVLG
jgi:hypothetical protein